MAKYYKSELTVSCESSARSRNFLGVLLSIIVLMLISSFIVVAIVILNPEIVSLSGKQYAPREAITLEEAMLGELSGNSFAYQWLTPPVGQEYDQLRDQGGQVYDELLFEDAKNLNTISIGKPSQGASSAGGQELSNAIELTSESSSTNTTNNNHLSQSAINHSSQPLPNHQQRPLAWVAKLTTLISNTSLLSSIDYQGFKLSPSKRYLLIWTSKRKQFRHTFTAKYFLYDIKLDLITLINTRQKTATGSDGEPVASANVFENLDSASRYLNQDDDDELARFQLVDWFSQAENRDSLIMVQNNDLYLLSDVAAIASGNTPRSGSLTPPIRLTFDGKQDEIFNGVPDWLYEEEILSDLPAFQLSPKSTSLAYMSFNDSQVEFMSFQNYGPAHNVIPRLQRIRYPKAGRVNPRVSVHVIDRLPIGGESAPDYPLGLADVKLQLPDNLASRQHYINRIRWLTDDRLGLVWLNRHQNESYFVVCARQTGWQCEKNLHLKAASGWLDLTDDLTPLDENHYLALLFKDEGADVGAFKHVAKISINQTDSYAFLTGGRREVTSINGVDRRRGILYYTATVENEPGQRQLFSASLNAGAIAEAQCVTCDHHPDECLYNQAKMSPSTSYYIFECDGPGVPRTELRLTRPPPTTDGTDKRQVYPPGPLTEDPAKLLKHDSSSEVAGFPLAPSESELANNSSSGGGHLPRADFEKPAAASSHPRAADSSLLWTIEDNQALRAKLTYGKGMPLTMRLKVPIPNTSYSANVLMLLPPQLGFRNTFGKAPTSGGGGGSPGSGRTRSPRDASAEPGAAAGSQSGPVRQALHAHYTPSSIGEYTSQLTSGQQYPMVVDVYGGPGSQRVDYRYHIGFGHYLASSRRTIYVMIDGRGSGYQGTKRLYELYHRLGSVEIEDQIEVTAYLTRNFAFIDPSKVAIWGWSYGGYASAMALARSNAQAVRELQSQVKELSGSNMSSSSSASSSSQSPAAATFTRPLPAFLAGNGRQHSRTSLPLGGVFECAASVAPVTNWIYYDTAYTERYMSAPYLNELYDERSVGDHDINDNRTNTNYRAPNSSFPISSEARNRDSRLEIGSKWLPLNHSAVIDSVDLQRTTSAASSLTELMQRASGRTNTATGSAADRARHNLNLNERYRNASLIEHIANIDRKRFLLIHGTADDNVHFQQSIMLMKRLIQRNVMFETRIYPDQDHGIANRADKLHLASTLSNFFAECFDMAQ